MAIKKKITKKSAGLKKSHSSKPRTKHSTLKRITVKTLAKKKVTPEKAGAPKKSPAIATHAKTDRGNEKLRKDQRLASPGLSRRSGGIQSGDLQGISNVESADSESVDELLEEGNSFEAGIVSGVEGSR